MVPRQPTPPQAATPRYPMTADRDQTRPPIETERLAPDDAGIARAAALLAAGEPVAIPTETVYGLAADARNGTTVARVYFAKGRPAFNPLIVHLPDLAAAERIARFDAEARALAQAFWPGPLTLVLPLRADAGIAPLVTAGLPTIALRLPAHAVARRLLAAAAMPLAAPSANRSGRISPTRAEHVLDPESGLGGRIAAVLDAGPCPVGVESTIVGWRNGAPVLLRPGGLPAEVLAEALGRPLLAAATAGDRPSAPGQLSSHYAPAVPLRLGAAPRAGETFIGFGHLPAGAPGDALNLSPAGDLVEAAANLFSLLHEADRRGRPVAVAPIPDHGLGTTIRDRLRRAAAPRP